MFAISHVATDDDITALTTLVRDYIAWAITLEEGSEAAPTFERLEEELRDLPGPYAPPTGLFLLATHDGRPAGCVAMLRHNARTCELRRLYVDPSFRGRGLGRELVATLLREAGRGGYSRMILDSHVSMRGAHALYESLGFYRVTAPDDFPEALKPRVVFMARDLDDM